MEAKGSGRRLKVRNVAWQMMSLTTILWIEYLLPIFAAFLPFLLYMMKFDQNRAEVPEVQDEAQELLVWMFWLMERGSRKAVRLHMLWVYYDENQEMVDRRVQHTHLVLPLVVEAKACLAAFQWAKERQLQCVFFQIVKF
ncbi:unnamed protein product [Camellia sinensis]